MKGIFFLAAFLVLLASAQATNYFALLYPTGVLTGSGNATFTTTDGEISCTLYVCGLTANAVLGFHIHEFGDISISSGASAGNHFNPYNVSHGCTGDRHVGDLGNVTIDATGCGTATVPVYQGSDDPTAKGYILGRGLVVHASYDNCQNPTGNAGSRLLFGVIGLATSQTINFPTSPAASIGSHAIAVMHATSAAGSFPNLVGSVSFTPEASDIWVFAYIKGLTPNTYFPLHIHEFGDLTSTASVGSHFNPYGVDHGCPGVNSSYHTGDMGNFMTDANGVLAASFTITNATLSLFTLNSIVGRAVVLHAQQDNCVDISSAGTRLAFGVIGFRQPTQSAEVVFQQYSHLGQTFTGTAVITPVYGGLGFYLTTTGFVEDSDHGVHIHEYGDVTAVNGGNFGGHFDPTNVAHGCPPSGEVGDLGNIHFNAGKSNFILSTTASLDPTSANYIVGRGMGITSSGDNCVSADSGGYNVLAGVIGIKNNSPALTYTASSTIPDSVNAVCVMQGVAGTAGAEITGNITLTPHDTGGTYFYFYLSGFDAHEDYSIHVHAYGDTSSAAATNTGGHFNPSNAPHGCPPTSNRHVGDMGTFTSDGNGKILALFHNELGFLTTNNAASLIGRGIIVHATADPCTANAVFGTRIAQCAIGWTSVKTRYDPTPTRAPPNSSDASVISWSVAAILVAVVALFTKF